MLDLIRKTILGAYIISTSVAQKTNFGVGFDLTLDYGIASIYFPNGTTAQVAKINGGPSYCRDLRTAMDAKAIPAEFTADRSGTIGVNFNSITKSQITPMIQTLCNHLPSWVCGKVEPRVQSLSRMLKALREATESYLETSIFAAEVVLPFPLSESAHLDLVSAASLVSLQMPAAHNLPSGIWAAVAHGIGKRKYDSYPDPSEPINPDPQLILTVQYTHADLTALLLEEKNGDFKIQRVLHRTDLGKGERPYFDQIYEGLFDALREVTALPLERDDNIPKLEYIDQLVLLGEAGGDWLLHHVLDRERDALHFRPSASILEDTAIDPLFVASMGIAQDCWNRIAFANNREL